MLELSLLLDCDCSTDEDEVGGSQAICWFEQTANRTKLDNPVTNAKTLFFISKPKFLFFNPYSAVPELTSALYAGAV